MRESGAVSGEEGRTNVMDGFCGKRQGRQAAAPAVEGSFNRGLFCWEAGGLHWPNSAEPEESANLS